MPPNENFVPYIPEAESFARSIAAGDIPLKAYKVITKWAKKNLVYDHVRAAKLAKDKTALPDPVRCWETHMGICTDISSLVVTMLRAVGVKAQLVIGWANKNYHAWVEAEIDGKKYRFDYGVGLIKPKYIPVRRY